MPVLYYFKISMNAAHRSFMYCWHRAEGGEAKNNPLNTTYKMAGATDYNQAGVKNYLTKRDGVTATIETLALSRYDKLRSLMKPAAPDWTAVAKEIEASGWGTSSSLLIAVCKSEGLIK